MRRWHSEREHAIMFRRWKEEMRLHRYDWRSPPTDPAACHCAKGIGSMRKRTPHGCSPGCWCKWEKLLTNRRRVNERRAAIELELALG